MKRKEARSDICLVLSWPIRITKIYKSINIFLINIFLFRKFLIIWLLCMCAHTHIHTISSIHTQTHQIGKFVFINFKFFYKL